MVAQARVADRIVEPVGPAFNFATGRKALLRYPTVSSTTSTYLTDLLGSTVALANSSSVVQTSYGYDAYGVATATGTSSDDPYQFTGRNNDGTGLYYYRARYYNPAWGRFISEDPLGLSAGVNLYGYASDSPAILTDPDGTFVGAAMLIAVALVAVLTPSPANAPGPCDQTVPPNDLRPYLNDAAAASPGIPFIGPILGGLGEAGPPTPSAAPDFVVTPGGTAYPVPPGSEGPIPAINSAGKTTGSAFVNGRGGMNGQVARMRIMDLTPPRGQSPGCPHGYIKYENINGQGVNPLTGQTVPNVSSHYPID